MARGGAACRTTNPSRRLRRRQQPTGTRPTGSDRAAAASSVERSAAPEAPSSQSTEDEEPTGRARRPPSSSMESGGEATEAGGVGGGPLAPTSSPPPPHRPSRGRPARRRASFESGNRSAPLVRGGMDLEEGELVGEAELEVRKQRVDDMESWMVAVPAAPATPLPPHEPSTGAPDAARAAVVGEGDVVEAPVGDDVVPVHGEREPWLGEEGGAVEVRVAREAAEDVAQDGARGELPGVVEDGGESVVVVAVGLLTIQIRRLRPHSTTSGAAK
uniref:Uncharacterized protein n=1 Tax=Oryza rufipogon TaxID=4529 RepID=A0A0E0Q4W8_ORYRU